MYFWSDCVHMLVPLLIDEQESHLSIAKNVARACRRKPSFVVVPKTHRLSWILNILFMLRKSFCERCTCSGSVQFARLIIVGYGSQIWKILNRHRSGSSPLVMGKKNAKDAATEATLELERHIKASPANGGDMQKSASLPSRPLEGILHSTSNTSDLASQFT